jgi:RHS repeat-associated protein
MQYNMVLRTSKSGTKLMPYAFILCLFTYLVCFASYAKESEPQINLTNWLTSPNGGESFAIGSTISIQINASVYTPAGNPAIVLELYKGTSRVWGPSYSGMTNRTISTSGLIAGTDYRVRIYNSSNSTEEDWSNTYFSLTSATLPNLSNWLTSPNGGENFTVGSTISIQINAGIYTPPGNPAIVIELYKGATMVVGGVSYGGMTNRTFSTSGLVTGTDYRFRIYNGSVPAEEDWSNSYFSITPAPPPNLSSWLTSPNGGENFTIGSTIPIQINAGIYVPAGNPAIVIELYKGTTMVVGGVSYGGMANRTFSMAGLETGSDYRFRIYNGSVPTEEDWSNGYFSVVSGGGEGGPCPAPKGYSGVGCNGGASVQLSASNTESSNYSICGKTISHNWYTSATGTGVVTPLVVSTGTCAVYQTFLTVTSPGSYWVSTLVDGCESARTLVTATYQTQPLQAPTGSGASRCGSGAVTLTATPGIAEKDIHWYNTQSGFEMPVATGTSYTTPALGSTKTYYISTYDPATGCDSPIPRVPVTATINPIPNEALGNDNFTCGPGAVHLTASPGANGNQVNWYPAMTGSTTIPSGNSFTTPSISSPVTYYISTYNTNTFCESSRESIHATVKEPPPAPKGYSGASCYAASSVQLSASNAESASYSICGKTLSHIWYTSETGSGIVTPLVVSTGTCAFYQTFFAATSSERYWVSTLIDGCESARTKVTASYSNEVPVLAVSPALNFNGSKYSGAVFCALNGIANPTLIASGGSGSSTYQWYETPAGGIPVHSGPTFTPVINLQSTTNGIKTYYVGGILRNNINCPFPITSRKEVSVKLLNYSDDITAGPDRELFINDAPVELTPHTPGNKWQGNGISPSPNDSMEQTPHFYPDQAGVGIHTIDHSYLWSYSDTDYKCETSHDQADYTVYPGSRIDVNYIITYTPQKSGFENEHLLQHSPVEDVTENTSYFDGLGRSMQNVVTQGSQGKQDIVQPIVYDEYGREKFKYPPFTAGNDGSYKRNSEIIDGNHNYMGIAESFYKPGSENKIADDSKPYTETIFEPSPLNRIIKQGNSGEVWQPNSISSDDSDKTIKKKYSSNIADEVLLWTYDPSTHRVTSKNGSSSLTYYPANSLFVIKTYDEHNNVVIEYTDKEGRVVLKRVQATTTPGSLTDSNKDTNYASTYYIYDDLNNLVVVIQPQGVSMLITPGIYHNASPPVQETFLKRWAFRYKYDSRKRMIEKWVPGADGPVTMVYDKRDRLVFTQDAYQGSGGIKYWTFTKYDELNRPILTGIKDTAATREGMQTAVDQHYEKEWAKWGESYIGDITASIHSYSNKSYPTTTSNGLPNPSDFLSVTYYDNYSFSNNWYGDYTYANENLSETSSGVLYPQPADAFQQVKGLVTGTKTKVLDGGIRGGLTWLKTVNYYDDRYRLIQSLSDNYKGGTDRTTTLFDFTGKVLRSKSTHIERDVTWKDLVGVTINGNRLIRNGATMSGAASVQKLEAGQNGSLEFELATIISTNSFYIGLNDANPDVNFTNINYAFFVANATLQVVENNGSNSVKVSQTNVLQPGDRLKIERMGTTVKYYRNGSLVWESLTPSSGALMVDVSFQQNNAILTDLRTSFSTSVQTVNRRFEYDHAGRLLKTWHQLSTGPNTGPEILLSKNEYNELGQLIDKKLHSTVADAANAKQSVDYRYNIRGWLTSMNNASLVQQAQTNDDTGDYFGFELGYNTDIGIANASNFNGNISGMKWSNNLGLADEKVKAYTYSYDALNRITDATFKEGSGSIASLSWTIPSGSAFSESGYTYDLNGNIKTLHRKDRNGTAMDNLTYDYGVGAAQSNRLLKVTDTGNDSSGFAEIESSNDSNVNDYKYDQNGNLIWDRNKGGVELQKNGEFTNGSADWEVTDTESRFTFANDRVEVAAGTSYSTLDQTGILQTHSPYIIILDITRTSASGFVTIITGNNGYDVSASGETVITAETASTSFFKLRASADFSGYINSVSVKGMLAVSYNYLNLPEKVFKGKNENLTYIYDATGRKLSQTVNSSSLKKITDYVGEFFYENDTLKFINHEEGRIVMTGAEPEYQYHLKDHLGNVRLTFTSKEEIENDKATLETENASEEQSKFLNHAEAVIVNHEIFDRTSDGTTNETYNATRLVGGLTDQVFGLARSLSVMPGDEISMEVYAKYLDLDPDSENWTSTYRTFLEAYASGTPPAGSVIDGGLPGSIGNGIFPFPAFIMPGPKSETAPKAYLNWIVCDRNHQPILGECGFVQIGSTGTLPKENGSNVAHELLKRATPLKINQPGYVYIYLSNENETSVEVFFDDFKVEHVKSPVVQMDDYYPFGLTFNSYKRENCVDQNYLYNSKELQDELDLNWLDFGFRYYDPAIARFTGIDPLADTYNWLTPYNYAENSPVANIDLWGLQKYYAADGSVMGQVGDNTDVRVVNSTMTNDQALETIQQGGVGSTQSMVDNSVPFADYFQTVGDVTNDAALETYSANGGNCFTAANAQLTNEGITQTGPTNAINTLVDNTAATNNKSNNNPNLTADPIGGAISVQTELNKGNPVMVGVKETKTDGTVPNANNRNALTGHFVVVRSSSVSADGTVSFNYLDNAKASTGKSANNNFSVNTTNGSMTDNTTPGGRTSYSSYVVSEVRKNQ